VSGVPARDLVGRRILVTGATGRVAFPIARGLAGSNTVFGAARLADPAAAARLEAADIVPVRVDVGRDDLDDLPDVDYVFHAAAFLGTDPDDWGRALEVNALASGRLVDRYRDVAGFVACSSASVYAYQGARPLREDDPAGLHLGLYSLSKIAGEAVVLHAATAHRVPTTVIRIFSAYGPSGGAPATRLDRVAAGKPIVLHSDRPNRYNPIFEDDTVLLATRALLAARVPPLVVNWAGSETVSAEEYCAYAGELVGRVPEFRYADDAPTALWADVARMHETLGATRVPWRDGMRRTLEARHPGLVR
jgi:UDP-glucuronate 4-epimerase